MDGVIAEESRQYKRVGGMHRENTNVSENEIRDSCRQQLGRFVRYLPASGSVEQSLNLIDDGVTAYSHSATHPQAICITIHLTSGAICMQQQQQQRTRGPFE